MDSSIQRVESALTKLGRRVHRVELYHSHGSQRLERSAYNVLVRLYDHGPQRLSELAAAFELDASTVSRQVRTLNASGLLQREPDPSDQRASLLQLTSAGQDALELTRARRRGVLRTVLSAWPSHDVTTFARLLEQFEADWLSDDMQALLRGAEPREDDVAEPAMAADETGR